MDRGGRKKGQRQIADVVEGYVVKDDIEVGYLNVVPLWNFGLCYLHRQTRGEWGTENEERLKVKG